MAVEIDVRVENIRKCADDLTKLAQRIQNYDPGFKVVKSRGMVALKTIEFAEALGAAADCLAELVAKTAQTTYTAAETFYEMDEGMKY